MEKKSLLKAKLKLIGTVHLNGEILLECVQTPLAQLFLFLPVIEKTT
jgi:hypothetical protein